jgi:glycosyltransferase involved in cell wall biosynthesis
LPAEVRILSVITRLGRGGSERRLYDVLDGVPGEHTVAVGRDSEDDAVAAMARRAEVVRVPTLVRAVEPHHDVRALVQLTRLMRGGSFDVVHTHQSKSGLLGRVAARAAGIGLVYHSASGASFGPGYGRAESAGFAVVERVTAPLVSRYFVVGHDLAAQLAANGISRRRLEVIRSSLDLRPFVPAGDDERRALRRSLGVDVDSAVVCYVGRLDRKKGVGPLPRLVASAAGTDRRITLLIAGDGPLLAELEAERDRYAADGLDLVLLGYLPSVADVVRGADLLVLPSPKEGLSQVLVQAAASDVPFVAFAVDGVAELLAMGARGRVVELGDEAGFAAAVGAALFDDADPAPSSAPVSRLRRDDRARWAEWDPASVAARYRDRYHQDLGIGDEGTVDQVSERRRR